MNKMMNDKERRWNGHIKALKGHIQTQANRNEYYEDYCLIGWLIIQLFSSATAFWISVRMISIR